MFKRKETLHQHSKHLQMQFLNFCKLLKFCKLSTDLLFLIHNKVMHDLNFLKIAVTKFHECITQMNHTVMYVES